MPLYANPQPFVWHKIETHHLSYTAMPTFMPPTPPVLVPPPNPFGPPPEPEPKAPADEKKDDPPKVEVPTSEEAPPAPAVEPGTYRDSLYTHHC